jgi:hypothetical protein
MLSGDCDSVGPAARRDGHMAAAISARAVVIIALVRRISADDAGGTVGDAADDTVAGGVMQRRLDVAPGEDDLIPRRQHVRPTDVREANTNQLQEGDVEGGGVNDAHRGVVQEDTEDLERAVAAAEEQSWRIVAFVAGEVEPWQVAPTGPEAEGVRHVDVAAGGLTAGHPNRRRSHTRRLQLDVCRRCT